MSGFKTLLAEARATGETIAVRDTILIAGYSRERADRALRPYVHPRDLSIPRVGDILIRVSRPVRIGGLPTVQVAMTPGGLPTVQRGGNMRVTVTFYQVINIALAIQSIDIREIAKRRTFAYDDLVTPIHNKFVESELRTFDTRRRQDSPGYGAFRNNRLVAVLWDGKPVLQTNTDGLDMERLDIEDVP
jgi:hypothetical protein